MEKYITLIFAGAVLLGLEVFIPGGIVGLLGVVLLVSAAFVALNTFGGALGVGLAVLALLVGCVMLLLIVRFFPRSYAGRKLSLETTMGESHGETEGLTALIDGEGVAVTVLRPSGFAEINGKRVDVVTRGENIEAGARLRVLEIEGNRVVVTKVS